MRAPPKSTSGFLFYDGAPGAGTACGRSAMSAARGRVGRATSSPCNLHAFEIRDARAESDRGDDMARYLSLHTLACLTRQGAEELTARLAAATRVTTRRVLVNMVEGKMLVEFQASDRPPLQHPLN